ncbi:MAG TPA: hypothetical protein VHJ83_01575, partial [Micromonosporaceae bacterium]|nr:hypothetical protein [Micromonosporaceae bacterium]
MKSSLATAGLAGARSSLFTPNALTGTAALTRLALRRGRINLPAWVLGLAGFTAATTAMWASDFDSAADVVQEMRVAATSPGIRMLGLASGASVGGYAMVRNYLLLAVLAALMSTFAVVRHTRQGEETGRAELIGAAVVGRHASLAAALIVTVGANVVLAVLLGLGMLLAGQPATGSFTAGAAVAAVGVAFAGVAAVTTQLTSSTRGASGLAAAVLGVAFLASGVGNMAGTVDPSGLRVESAWSAWLSPIGWGQQMRPFGGDHWWPLVLAVALFLAGTGAAALLATRRDFGHGMLPQRPGHARASRALRSPLGLAWRLQRGALLGWAVGMIGFGLIMGGLIGQVRDTTGPARDWYTTLAGSDEILGAYRASVLQMAGQPRRHRVVRCHRTGAAVRPRHGTGGWWGTRRPGRTSKQPARGRPGTAARDPRDRRRGGRRGRAVSPLRWPGVLGAPDGVHRGRPAVWPRPQAASVGPGPLAVHPRPQGSGGPGHGDSGPLAARCRHGPAPDRPGVT